VFLFVFDFVFLLLLLLFFCFLKDVISLDIVHSLDEVIHHAVQTSDNFVLLALAQTIGLESKKRAETTRFSLSNDVLDRFRRRKRVETIPADYRDPYEIGVELINRTVVEQFHMPAESFSMYSACGYVHADQVTMKGVIAFLRGVLTHPDPHYFQQHMHVPATNGWQYYRFLNSPVGGRAFVKGTKEDNLGIDGLVGYLDNPNYEQVLFAMFTRGASKADRSRLEELVEALFVMHPRAERKTNSK